MTEKPRQRGQLHPGQVGTMAEEAVLAYLQRLGKAVEDVRKDANWQWRDVDYIATAGKTTEYVEVKCDTWLNKTGNIFLEVRRDNGGPGCFLRSKADWWYYVNAETGDTLILPLSAAQAWLITNMDKAHGTDTRSHRRGQFARFFGYKVNAELIANELGAQRVTLPLG